MQTNTQTTHSAHMAQELPAMSAHEKNFIDMVKTMVESYRGTDCRELAKPIRHTAGLCNIQIAVGCGASHIWVHRLAEHKEGNPIESKRFVIITDKKLWANYWEKETNGN